MTILHRKFVYVLMFVLILGVAGTAAEASSKQFTDVHNTYWAKEQIDYLTSKEIISGYPNGAFGINDPISRAQAATMIMRYFGWNDPNPNDPGYTDLKPGSHWAYNDIATLYHLGIFAPKGKYMPDKEVTRAEMADMLVKAFELSSIKGAKFTDLSRDHWAYQPINILAGNNITTGYTDGSFRPDASVTRVEFAVFMSRAMDERYRVKDQHPTVDGIIYDLDINNSIIQLTDPLLLHDEWLAPVELFERLGFTVQTPSSSKVVLTSSEGQEIELEIGQQEVWVGDTSAEVKEPLVKVDGKYYIKAYEILKALEKPLVFYPDQFLIRLEAPRITAKDIVAQLPESALDVIHPSLPYWQWTKKDRDYLELLRKNGQSIRNQLIRELEQLTQLYYRVEQEKLNLQGIIYFTNEVSGKLDALARGLEARYLLLAQSTSYQYPDIAKSTNTSLNSNFYSSIYTVYDHSFMDIAERSEQLLKEIATNTELPFELFEGLTVHGLPFSILETEPGGRKNSYAGLASGNSMVVVNSGIYTFFHEFGHNWDFRLGNHEEYLKIRGKAGYIPPTSEWEDRVQENFAEDFAVTFLPTQYGEGVHKGSFGMPTEAEKAAIRQFVLSRSKSAAAIKEFVALNGATFIPDVIYSADGKLHVTGATGHHMFATIENLQTGESETIDLAENSTSVDRVLSLPQKGIYKVHIGSIGTIVVYQ